MCEVRNDRFLRPAKRQSLGLPWFAIPDQALSEAVEELVEFARV